MRSIGETMNYSDMIQPGLFDGVSQAAKAFGIKTILQSERLKRVLAHPTTPQPELARKPTVSIGGGIGSTLLLPYYLTHMAHKNRFNFVYCAIENDEKDVIEAVEKTLDITIHRIDPAGNVRGKDYAGFNIWSVYFATSYLGNWTADPCSRVLKREAMAKFITANNITRLHVGIDREEIDRSMAIVKHYQRQSVDVKMPLIHDGVWNWFKRKFGTTDQKELCKAILGFLPASYEKDLPHHNCSDFCIKAGKAQTERAFWYDRDMYRLFGDMEIIFNRYVYPDSDKFFTVYRLQQHEINEHGEVKNRSIPIRMHNLLDGFEHTWRGMLMPKFEPLDTTGCVWCGIA